MYVGHTECQLKLTFLHKASFRNGNMDYAIDRHYKEKNHGSASYLRFIGTERVKPNRRLAGLPLTQHGKMTWYMTT